MSASKPPKPQIVPQVSVGIHPKGVLVTLTPPTNDIMILATCLDHAAAQMRLLGEVGLANGERLSLNQAKSKKAGE